MVLLTWKSGHAYTASMALRPAISEQRGPDNQSSVVLLNELCICVSSSCMLDTVCMYEQAI